MIHKLQPHSTARGYFAPSADMAIPCPVFPYQRQLRASQAAGCFVAYIDYVAVIFVFLFQSQVERNHILSYYIDWAAKASRNSTPLVHSVPIRQATSTSISFSDSSTASTNRAWQQACPEVPGTHSSTGASASPSTTTSP